jgi:hypothetical protein
LRLKPAMTAYAFHASRVALSAMDH